MSAIRSEDGYVVRCCIAAAHVPSQVDHKARILAALDRILDRLTTVETRANEMREALEEIERLGLDERLKMETPLQMQLARSIARTVLTTTNTPSNSPKETPSHLSGACANGRHDDCTGLVPMGPQPNQWHGCNCACHNGVLE